MASWFGPMAADFSRMILMGDPAYFRIKAGANSHTRNRWGQRKKVDAVKARRQWDQAVDTLRSRGIQVEVLPGSKENPGSVFPANAGFLLQKDQNIPVRQRQFYLANLSPGRAGEREHYRKVLDRLGFQVEDLPTALRFEGEADFFPVAGGHVLTYGRLCAPCWRPRLGMPPYRREYGFRTDKAILQTLRALCPGQKIWALELAQEAYYHGDTVLCSVGRKREHLLVYAQGLTPVSLAALKSDFPGTLHMLSDADARRFAANSFYVDAGYEQWLFCPAGLSEAFHGLIASLGIAAVPLDVSEFFEKGGGSVKCMLCDLGAAGR